MSRLHDMGGRFGDGLIPLPRDAENEVTNFEPTFKYEDILSVQFKARPDD